MPVDGNGSSVVQILLLLHQFPRQFLYIIALQFSYKLSIKFRRLTMGPWNCYHSVEMKTAIGLWMSDGVEEEKISPETASGAAATTESNFTKTICNLLWVVWLSSSGPRKFTAMQGHHVVHVAPFPNYHKLWKYLLAPKTRRQISSLVASCFLGGGGGGKSIF